MTSTFFCDLEALTIHQRQRHAELAKQLRPLVVDYKELSDGYAITVRSVQSVEADLEEFMTLEMLCCPFFTLGLEFENRNANEEQTYVLKITGRGDIKPFIRDEFGIPSNQNAT